MAAHFWRISALLVLFVIVCEINYGEGKNKNTSLRLKKVTSQALFQTFSCSYSDSLMFVACIREVKQNFLSNVPAADSHYNYFGISPSYWRNLFLTGCATSCVA